jgi:hypothetical protein
MEPHLRPDLLANGTSSVAPVLFGTTVLSAVSAFATAKAVHGRKVNRLHPAGAVPATLHRRGVAVGPAE